MLESDSVGKISTIELECLYKAILVLGLSNSLSKVLKTLTK